MYAAGVKPGVVHTKKKADDKQLEAFVGFTL
jgi:hypothetical protein